MDTRAKKVDPVPVTTPDDVERRKLAADDFYARTSYDVTPTRDAAMAATQAEAERLDLED